MNLYATLNDLKVQLGTTSGENNADLMRVLEAVSRQIEQSKMTDRFFYCWEGVRYYDGAPDRLWLPDDILAITTLKCDQDGDGVFESIMAPADYFIYPLNYYPKIRLKVNPSGSFSGFAPGISKGIEVTGVFGYANSATPYEAKTALNEVSGITAVQTKFAVDDGKQIKIGQTIRIESEQMFVTDVVQNEVYVEREGLNGTIAATHADDKVVSVYTYPEDITHAVLILAMRAWKRKDSAYQDIVGIAETGQLIASKGVDPDVTEIVAPYRRQQYC